LPRRDAGFKNLQLFMRDARSFSMLLGASLLFFGFAHEASAQLFGRSRQMRKASEMIHRQPPPVVNASLADAVTPDNAKVVISLSKQRAYLMAGDDVYIDTPISSGKRAGMTPTGSFTVLEKDPDHRSSIYGDFVDRSGRVVRAGVSLKVDSAPSGTRYVGAPMRFFMRLTSGGVGMHIGILPGYPASHGCVRLPAAIAPLIYRKVKIGTPVTIEP
jgi:lipoprotein-anchoring transpeptidase ErfK/SrfK